MQRLHQNQLLLNLPGNARAIVIDEDVADMSLPIGARVKDKFFLAAVVDPDHSVCEAPRAELARNVAEAAARAENDDPFTRFGIRFPERGVGGQTGAKHGGGG